MEVIQIKNNHLYKEGGEKEYGCKCKNCGTKFIFQEHEGYVPRCIDPKSEPKPEQCSICCPNCKQFIRYSECTELKSQKENFAFHQVW